MFPLSLKFNLHGNKHTSLWEKIVIEEKKYSCGFPNARYNDDLVNKYCRLVLESKDVSHDSGHEEEWQETINDYGDIC